MLGYRTDHSIILLEMQVGDLTRGPGLWKFNESLLDDEEYVAIVEQCIEQGRGNRGGQWGQLAPPNFGAGGAVPPPNFQR